MKQSQLFTKTRKEAPKDEVSVNADMLIRGGFINKEMAGVYSYLPLGLRVMKKIENIVREEMNAVGGQEISMTALQEPEVWKKTGRWSDEVVDNWFKTKLKNETEVGLGFTHEEPLTMIMKQHVSSYRDLPSYVYQFQNKFRNEARAKSGIMRGREFLMKDLYSFSKDESEHASFYEKMKGAYAKVFERVGLGEVTYLTFASGGSFSKFSHEFQTVTDAGEDIIYVTKEKVDGKHVAINKEVFSPEIIKDFNLEEKDFKEVKSVEVGNIFNLGTRFSDALDLNYLDEHSQKTPVVMGSYGIGIGRLMGTVVEVFANENGIVWPEAIAPFKAHLVYVTGKNNEAREYAESLYAKLQKKGIEVLFDDRDARAGEKFADADLIGIPHRVVVSDKTFEAGKLEYKSRAEAHAKMIEEKELLEMLDTKAIPHV